MGRMNVEEYEKGVGPKLLQEGGPAERNGLPTKQVPAEKSFGALSHGKSHRKALASRDLGVQVSRLALAAQGVVAIGQWIAFSVSMSPESRNHGLIRPSLRQVAVESLGGRR